MRSERHELIVVQVEVVKILEVLDCLRGDLAQLVLGQDKVAHRVALGRDGVGTHGLQLYGNNQNRLIQKYCIDRSISKRY